jgi:hypothetical protein
MARFATLDVLAIGDAASPELASARQRLDHLGCTLEVHAAIGPIGGEAAGEDLSRRPLAAEHFRSPSLAHALRDRLASSPPDVVHFEELVMAQYEAAFRCPTSIDRQKLEWSFLEALAELEPGSPARLTEARRFQRWEERLSGRFGAVITTGAVDARALARYHDGVHVVPIAVADSLAAPPGRTRAVDHVLLYGTRDYPPNVDSTRHYLEQIWPLLRERAPDLFTRVVGSGEPRAADLAGPGIESLGFVEDVAPILSGSGVLVVPLRIGGGARTKILEALACGMPVVSTRVGVENLELEAGRHFMLAETPLDFVEAVLRLRRDPELATALAREGELRVSEQHRVASNAARLEAIYRGLRHPGPWMRERRRRRALLIGVAPLPEASRSRQLSFPGYRTAQFRDVLDSTGFDLRMALLDEEPGRGDEIARGERLEPRGFLTGVARLHSEWEPDIVVTAGGYHAARAGSHLDTPRPLWIDLAGDLAAEGQLRAARTMDETAASGHLAVLRLALTRGDHFSVVGASQRLALLGQLGLAGRLSGSRLGEEPVSVLPVTCDGPDALPPPGGAGLRLLWGGSYNTWMDEVTLSKGLELAMDERPDLELVGTAGGVPGHDESAWRVFWERARASRHAGRFRDLGRLPRSEAREVLLGCHATLAISRPCLELELGSRLRVVEAMAHGRPAVLTGLGDLARAIGEAESGVLVPASDPRALASALVGLDARRLEEMGRRAFEQWRRSWTRAALQPLAEWIERPSRWPRPEPGSSSEARALRLEAELEVFRSSLTFRALRRLDRLLGRG